MGVGAAISGGLALAGGLEGLFGGGNTAQNVQLPPQFNMPRMGAAAGGALGGIQNLPGQGYGNITSPLALQTGLNLYNNPYAGGYQGAAGGAGNLAQTQALNQYGTGGQLIGAGGELMGLGPTLAAMGLDPQGALYNRTAGQLQDRTLANLSNAGIGTTPFGQSVLGNTLGNFNIDWQNQQLQRALAGAQGASGVMGAGAGLVGQGTGLQAGAPGQFLQGGALPYQAFQNIGQGQLGGLQGAQSVVGGAQNLSQLPIQDYLSYLGVGNQAGGVANQQAATALAQAQQIFNQNQAFGQSLGQGAGMLGYGLFGGGGQPGMIPQGWGNTGPSMPGSYGGYNVTGTPFVP